MVRTYRSENTPSCLPYISYMKYAEKRQSCININIIIIIYDVHRHTQMYTQPKLTHPSLRCTNTNISIKKWPQGDRINYSKLQVGMFGCQTSLSHTREKGILPYELNMTQTHTQIHRFKHIHTVCEYTSMFSSHEFGHTAMCT